MKKRNDDLAIAQAAEFKSGKKNKTGAMRSTVVEELDPVYQDQGFTRPRVLVLCPFRGSAFVYLETLRNLLGVDTTVSGLDKFIDEFSAESEDDDEDINKVIVNFF